ncbi:hypothetical protein [Dysgonomonas sp. 511]|uniref:DUF3244 domain-containing protein n=1 Tax=Dysgonomonas sp. 511 TaxID=2302930 RepID=UPI0013D71EFC|nr:hypothetical protein [Dysgonomonas sp. 511]NDV77497.1 hypothetical protein [Dysgonomonas sp. 511]
MKKTFLLIALFAFLGLGNISIGNAKNVAPENDWIDTIFDINDEWDELWPGEIMTSGRPTLTKIPMFVTLRVFQNSSYLKVNYLKEKGLGITIKDAESNIVYLATYTQDESNEILIETFGFDSGKYLMIFSNEEGTPFAKVDVTIQ